MSPQAKWRTTDAGGKRESGSPRTGGRSGLLKSSGDEAESVNLSELADQKSAGQSLGASGSDHQQDCKFLHEA